MAAMADNATVDTAIVAALAPEAVATVGFATQAEPTNLGVAALMAAQVASSVPTTTQVLAVATEQTSVPPLPAQSAEAAHATQAAFTNLGMAVEMAAQVASVEPAATQVLAVAVEQTSAPALPVQSAEAAHATQAEPTNLGLAALMAAQVAASVPAAIHAVETVDHAGLAVSMAAHVASLEPTATQVLTVAVEQTSVPVQSEVPRQATQDPLPAAASHLGVAASLATQLSSSVAAVQQAALSAGVSILHEAAAASVPLSPHAVHTPSAVGNDW